MQKIIFITKYYCQLCKKDQVVNIYGEPNSVFTPEEEPELIKWAKHYHWVDTHRTCALCGKLVLSNELELLVNEGNVFIHKNYTDEYEKIKGNDSFGHLLIVHEKCLKISHAKKEKLH